MNINIAVTHRIHHDVLVQLQKHGRTVAPEISEALTRAELETICPSLDALMVFMPDRIDAAFLATCPRLKIVACALKGFDNIDVDACTQMGVWVTIVPDLLIAPTAELAVGLLISLSRNIQAGDRFVRTGAFSGWRPAFYGCGLAGKQAAIISFGKLGQAIARRLNAFDMQLLFYDPFVAQDSIDVDFASQEKDLDTLLATSDYVILACPLTDKTLHLIDQRRLENTKYGAYLINVGRGSVVDEQAVLDALNSGFLAGYAADVFEMEDHSRHSHPRRIPDGLLTCHDNTVLTPHLGSAVGYIRQAIEHTAANSIIDLISGVRPRHAINGPLRI